MLESGQIAGVADEDAAAVVVVADDSGPLYGTEETLENDAPIPTPKKLVAAVLAAGATDDRLVEYGVLGSAPCGI